MPEEYDDTLNILITGLRDIADRLDRYRSSEAPQNKKKEKVVMPEISESELESHETIRRNLGLVFEQHEDSLNDFEKRFTKDNAAKKGQMSEKQLHCAGKILANYEIDVPF